VPRAPRSTLHVSTSWSHLVTRIAFHVDHLAQSLISDNTFVTPADGLRHSVGLTWSHRRPSSHVALSLAAPGHSQAAITYLSNSFSLCFSSRRKFSHFQEQHYSLSPPLLAASSSLFLPSPPPLNATAGFLIKRRSVAKRLNWTHLSPAAPPKKAGWLPQKKAKAAIAPDTLFVAVDKVFSLVDPPSSLRIDGSKRARGGESVQLRCKAEGANPKPKLHWSVNGRRVEGAANSPEM